MVGAELVVLVVVVLVAILIVAIIFGLPVSMPCKSSNDSRIRRKCILVFVEILLLLLLLLF